MAISYMADDGQTITVSQDAAMYNFFAGGIDYVIGGIGDELAVNNNTSSLQVTLGTGEGVICGRHFNVTGTDTTLTLSPTSTGALVIRYDTTQSTGNIVKFMAVSVNSLESDNLNNGGTAHDLLLGIYSTSASGVASFTDRRAIYTAPPVSNTAHSNTADSATTATTAAKLGTATVGGARKPIYLSNGSPTAISDTVGGVAQPVYLNGGTVTALSQTVGSATKPIFSNGGTLTALSQTVGGAAKPVYLNGGTITALSQTVGSTNQLTYLNGGTVTAGMTIRSGTATPDASLGSDGDIYIQYTE